jgi:hypothetical protein
MAGFVNICGKRVNAHGDIGSIFYFGYLAGQYPAGYLLQRLPIGKFLGICTLGMLHLRNFQLHTNTTRLGGNLDDHSSMP